MSDPELSVLLAVHNGESWLDAALASLRAQTWKRWEVVVVDNGSTDTSFDIAARHAAEDPRVRPFRLDQKGKNLAYNHAFEQSVGAFVSYFAADDLLPPDSIEKRIAPLWGEGKGVFSTSAMRTISKYPKFDGLVMPRNIARPNFSGGVLLFSRDLAAQIFPLPIDLPNEDTWTQLHLRAFGRHFHVPEVLYCYRIHDQNSFGYGVPFQVRRDGFLRRMRAYELFFEKYHTPLCRNTFIDIDVRQFAKSIPMLRSDKRMKIILSRKISISNKLLFIHYSFPFVYWLRSKLFRVFSGLMVQN